MTLKSLPGAGEGEARRQVVLTEKQLQAQVIALARLRGWSCYHAFLSIKSEPGWPDLTLVGQGHILFRELKTDRGKVTASQQKWLDELNACGGDADVWRTADLLSGRIMRELAPRWSR